MTVVFLYDKGGNFIQKEEISTPIEESGIENLHINYSSTNKPNEELAVFFKNLNPFTIIPSIILQENSELFIQNLSLSKNERFAIFAVDVKENYTTIKKYDLWENRFVKESMIQGDVHYIFSDENRVLISFLNQEKFFSIAQLNNLKNQSIYFNHTKNIIAYAVLESSNRLALSSKDNQVKNWDIENGNCIETIILDDYAEKIILPNSSIIIGWKSRPRLWAWSLDFHRFVLVKNDILPSVVKFYEKQNTLLVGTQDGKIFCYSMINGELNWKIKVYNSCVNNLDFFCETSKIVTFETGEMLVIIDAKSGQIKKKKIVNSQNGYHVIKLKHDGLIVSGRDANIRVWDIKNTQCVALLSGHIHFIKDMYMTPDFKCLISRDQAGRIILWKADWENVIKNSRYIG